MTVHSSPSHRIVRWLVVPFLALALVPLTLWAQANTTGGITGRVTDPSGAVIVGATVKLVNPATGNAQNASTDQSGRFIFTNLTPGYYNVVVTHSGFQSVTLTRNLVVTNQTLALKVALKVGRSSTTVEVNGSAGPALQTLNATMSSTITASTLLQLPSLDRDVTSLMNLQATSTPSYGRRGDITSGSVAGSTPDQNTFVLDGGINTSGLEGDNGYINGFSGNQRGVVPTPIESIQQFTVSTNNMTSDFATSSGAEVLAVTKRGYNTWHGSIYDYLQSSVLNANGWNNNFHNSPRPKTHQNRYGFDLGGVLFPRFWGGKTYFYFDYEAQRYPQSGFYEAYTPSPLLRQGIIQINTSHGVQKFDLGSGKLAVCGPNGNGLCDPLGIGMSSAVSQIWSKYMPAANDASGGDQLNSLGFRGILNTPVNNDFWVGRFDHDFGSNWRWMGTYRWYKDYNPVSSQVDIGGLLPGDTLGQPAAASENINEPALIVTALSGSITPNLTNVFHFTYTRNMWGWIRNGLTPQLSGMPGVLEINGEGKTSELNPVNADTQDSRQRSWYEHNYDFRDEMSWLHGNHLFQFGGDWLHEWWHFNRYDNVVGGLTSLVYEVSDGSLHMTPTYQPPTCSATITTNCFDSGTLGASEISTWNNYYADLLGIVNHSSIVATRTGANLQLNPLGTPLSSLVTVNTPDLYFTDTWHVLPTLTLTYGLNWGVQMPPYEQNREQDIAVNAANNQPIYFQSYIANRVAAAEKGQVYLPTLGYSPIAKVPSLGKYPFAPYYKEFAPHVSAAWNPDWHNWFAGDQGLVIRGGFGRFFARDYGINVISNPTLGDGFLQPVSCTGPSVSGQCLGQDVATPQNAFRIGPNGLKVPLPPITPTLSSPVTPGISAPYATLLDIMDPNFRPGVSNELDFSVQRQFGQNTTLEVGYVGVWANHLFQGIDLNSVPWMMKYGGQQFTQAWDNMYHYVQAHGLGGAAIANAPAQPFLEAALAGQNYCSNSSGTAVTCGSAGANYPNYTQAVLANEGQNIAGDNLMNFWSDLDGSWAFGPTLYSTNQGFYIYGNTSTGFSNYQAMVVKLKERAARGLTFNANFTYSHDLGTLGLSQTYTLDSPDNVYNLQSDLTPAPWDQKFIFNFLGTYELPFGQGQHGWIGKLIGGWLVSPVLTMSSGLPVEVYTGSFGEMGAGFAENGASAVAIGGKVGSSNWPSTPILGTVVPTNASNPNSVGVNGNPANGGTGVNLFGSEAINFYNSFRPFLLGVDGAPSPDGEFRGMPRWNIDLGVTKDTQITERVHAQIFAQAFNLFNIMQFSNPFLDLQYPQAWGVLGGQANQPRIIQLGLRFSF